jgi:hypothetical protein
MMKGFFICVTLESKTKKDYFVLLEHLGVVYIIELVGMDKMPITIRNQPNRCGIRSLQFEDLSLG